VDHRVAEGELNHEDIFTGPFEDLAGESFTEGMGADDAHDRGVDPGGPGGVFYPAVKSITVGPAGGERGAGNELITAAGAT